MVEQEFIANVVQSRRGMDYVQQHATKQFVSLLSPQAQLVYNLAALYYFSDEHADHVPDDFLVHEMKEITPAIKEQKLLEQYIKDLPNVEASPENMSRLFLLTQKESIKRSLAQALVSGDKDEVIAELYENLESVSADGQVASGDYEQLLHNKLPSELIAEMQDVGHGLIKLRPESLNRRIDGGALRGHHILAFARPDAGKTLWVVDNIAGFLEQGLSVLYVGNEEPVTATLSRVHTRITGMTKHEIEANPELADKLLGQSNFDKLTMAGIAGSNLKVIEALVKDVRPDVLIVDQLRNVHAKGESRTLQLEYAARGVRELGLKYNCLPISITQAGDSASNKLVLEMGDVDFSNTGIPGAVDLMIGIGTNFDYNRENHRMLSLCKNKLSNEKGSHSYFQIGIDPQLHKTEVLEA